MTRLWERKGDLKKKMDGRLDEDEEMKLVEMVGMARIELD